MINQENQNNASNGQVESQPRRRAYAKPVVVDLGDVRELTLGGTGSGPDAHGGGHG